ncbi:hypothetical protein VCUG_02310 [Vavraia culicis subsp. floridensis]|uniref:Uncharacterized protein n=1 Tax=Vavraia culicis (isolate floridensis) TaxID=948595 RepID=L2GRE1_VAVCU|nr:uncharacterized protein VCUG_02310 [Vavraia culicis subsp. floridensis]ELA46199.1 hypothetical protein VCUG_02310 [Vavraia culicis subsp. floridensis]
MFYNIGHVTHLTTNLFLRFCLEESDAPLYEYVAYDALFDLNRDMDTGALEKIGDFLNLFDHYDEFLPEQHVRSALNNRRIRSREEQFKIALKKEMKLFPNRHVVVKEILVSCRIVRLPMTRVMCEKIVDMMRNRSEMIFTIKDLHTILLNWFWYFMKEKRAVFNICQVLQSIPNSLYKLRCLDEEKGTENGQPTKRLRMDNWPLQTNIDLNVLRCAVQSEMCFTLRDDDFQTSVSPENQSRNKLEWQFDLKDLNIGYLISELEINYRYLIENEQLLHKKFADDCSLIVTVNLEVVKRKSNMSDERIVEQMVRNTLASQFLNCDSVTDIILYVHGGDCPQDLFEIPLSKKFTKIILVNCSLRLVQALSYYTEHVCVHSDAYKFQKLQLLPANVKELRLTNLKFLNDYLLPDNIECFALKNSVLSNGSVLRINENIRAIDVVSTPGHYSLPKRTGLSDIVLPETDGCALEFVHCIDNSACLRMESVEIDQEVTLPFTNISLINVSVSSRLVIAETMEKIVINKCSGLFDISNILLDYKGKFNRGMSLRYEMNKGTSALEIRKFVFNNTIKIREDVSTLILDRIIVERNSSLEVNTRCEKIVVNGCYARIILSNIINLTNIDLSTYGVDDLVLVFPRCLDTVKILKIRYNYVNTCVLEKLVKTCRNMERFHLWHSLQEMSENAGTYMLGSIDSCDGMPHEVAYPLEPHNNTHSRTTSNSQHIHWKRNTKINEFLCSVLAEHANTNIYEMELSGFAITYDNFHQIHLHYLLERLVLCPYWLLSAIFQHSFPMLKYLKLCQGYEQETDMTRIKDPSNAYLSTFHQLETFISTNYIFGDPQFLLSLPKNLKNLELPLYEFEDELLTEIVRDKLRIRRLVIHHPNFGEELFENNKINEASTLAEMVRTLCEYLEFTSLDFFAYKSGHVIYYLDPISLKIIESTNETADLNE